MRNTHETPKAFKNVKVGENFLMSDGKFTKKSSRTAESWRTGNKIYLKADLPVRQVKHSWGWGV